MMAAATAHHTSARNRFIGFPTWCKTMRPTTARMAVAMARTSASGMAKCTIMA